MLLYKHRLAGLYFVLMFLYFLQISLYSYMIISALKENWHQLTVNVLKIAPTIKYKHLSKSTLNAASSEQTK